VGVRGILVDYAGRHAQDLDSMKKSKTVLLMTFGIAALIVAYGCYDFYRIPLDRMTVYATEKGYPAWVQSLATYRLKHLSHCPSEQFKPSTPLSFLVAAMDSADTDLERAKELFRHYQSVGCDINAANRGLRPIHEAILFKNISIVSYLLENGANPNLKIEEPSKQAGLDAFQWADQVCAKNKEKCVELRVALKKKI